MVYLERIRPRNLTKFSRSTKSRLLLGMVIMGAIVLHVNDYLWLGRSIMQLGLLPWLLLLVLSYHGMLIRLPGYGMYMLFALSGVMATEYAIFTPGFEWAVMVASVTIALLLLSVLT